MNSARAEWLTLGAYAQALSDQIRQAPYSGIDPDTRILAEACATFLGCLNREIRWGTVPKLPLAQAVSTREGIMHLQIKLTIEETELWYNRGEVAMRREFLRALFVKAVKLAMRDGNPVDIVDNNGAIIDTVD